MTRTWRTGGPIHVETLDDLGVGWCQIAPRRPTRRNAKAPPAQEKAEGQ